jgi:hypothetical protein
MKLSRTIGYTLFAAIVLVLFTVVFSREPGFANESDATIRVYQKDSLVYTWENVKKGKFEWHNESSPRSICITASDGHTTITEEADNPFRIEIDYLDEAVADLVME